MSPNAVCDSPRMTRRDLRRRPRETSAASGPFALFMFDGLCCCDLVLLLSRFAPMQDLFIVAKDLSIAAKCPACRKPSCGERDSGHNRAKRGAMELRRIRSLLAQSGPTETRVILSASLIGRLRQAFSGYPPARVRCGS